MVAASELTEISVTGKYAVLANREKIFFRGEQAAAVLAFAERNGLTRLKRADIWQLVAAPFDQEQNHDSTAANETTLLKSNARPNEVRRARQALWCWWWLSLRGLEGDEWYRYDHEDVLYMTGCSLLPRRRWYWRTMELALRAPATTAA
ncbi:hypothetical protein GCM10027422_05600 [Hymenobacter arcticus]